MNSFRKMALCLALLSAFMIFAGARVQAQTVVPFNGFEVSQGDREISESYGWLCYGRTTGALPGNFTMSMNYDHPTYFRGGVTNFVDGGNWTLPVYGQTMGGLTYMGVLYGSVTSGTIKWDALGYIGTMDLNLDIIGGTQTVADLHGTVEVKLTINRSPAAIAYGPPPMTGTLSFNFR
jgi:hypothetical protein